MKKALVFLLSITCTMLGQEGKPRVFLQSASHGNTWNARRDQSIEMAKDFQKACPDTRVTLNQNAADYTVILNHIEVGLFARDNQMEVANKDGDLLATREKGGIMGGVKGVCTIIMADWHNKLGAPEPQSSVDASTSKTEAQTQPAPDQPDGFSVPMTGTAKMPAASHLPNSAAPPSVARSMDGTGSGTQTSSTPKPNGGALPGVTLRTSEQGGAEIVEIAPDSAAGLAGLHAGDVITSVDGKRVRSAPDLAAAVANRASGSKIRIGFMFRSNTLGWMQGEDKLINLNVQ